MGAQNRTSSHPIKQWGASTSSSVLVGTGDCLPARYAKRQRHVRFWLEQRALYETTAGRWKWLHFHSSSLGSFVWHRQQSFKPLILACPDSLPWALSAHPLLPAEWQSWAPVGPNQNLRAQQGAESSWVASLPLLALPGLAELFPSLICIFFPHPQETLPALHRPVKMSTG